MRFTIFQESRKGSRRINQDRIAYTYGRDTLLMVVADGMGGHAGGEIAAQICVRLFVERFQQEAKPILRNPLKFLQDTMLRAHAALGSYANQFSMLETPRTTCVAVVVQAGFAHWAHVGDSRFYLFRQGTLIGSTKDHSKVQYLVDQGIIGAHDVAQHPDRNKIFSCLGGLVDPVIDLSKRAAATLGIRGGTARVRVETHAGDQPTQDLQDQVAALVARGAAKSDAKTSAQERH